MIPRLDIRFPLRKQLLFAKGKPCFPEEDSYFLDHGRSAILLALRAAGLSAGAGVGVMAYNCHTVMHVVAHAGFTPVFLDVTDALTLDLEDLKQKASSMSALIVTHLFGVVSDVRQIRALFPNLIVIEDCAHAYGIDSLYGDFAAFSLGQGKLPSIGDGGILRVLNSRYSRTVAMLYAELPDYSWAQSVKLFVRMWVKSLLYSRFLYGWLTWPIKNKRGIPSGEGAIQPKKMCEGISAVFSAERQILPHMIDLRKQNAVKMMKVVPIDTADAVIGCNGFMLVVHCENPVTLQAKFRNKGIETETHFAHSIDWAGAYGYSKGTCPNAEKLIHHLLMVPTYLKSEEL